MPPITKSNLPRGARAAATAVILLVVAAGGIAWAATTLRVVQKEAAIRDRKRNFGKPLAVVGEPQEVTLLGEEPPWRRVKMGAVEGWIHESALTADPKCVFSSAPVASGVRATEQTAGNRGFNEEVEQEYRGQHRSLESAYLLLDALQDRKVADEDLEAFLSAGGLAAGQ